MADNNVAALMVRWRLSATLVLCPQKPLCLTKDALHHCSLQQRVRRLPWRPWLTQAEARRGVTYSGSGAAMRRLAGKLLAGQPVSIVAIGGSVTASGGLDAHGQVQVTLARLLYRMTDDPSTAPTFLPSCNPPSRRAILLASSSM